MKLKNFFKFILFVVVIAVMGIIVVPKLFNKSGQIACTQEAKICSDGSGVGRTGPMCAFALCPSEINKTYTDTARGISFEYPEQLSTSYIHVQEWPPQIQILHTPLSCTEKRIVNNRAYCVTERNEGAPGSIYTTYTYATEKNNSVATLTFVLRAVQCGNYDDPQKTACAHERATFDLDSIVDRILESLKTT